MTTTTTAGSSASFESSQTKSRLLVAAGEVFAERGFANATVRDICDRAKANVAAINYHFQSKERLYSAVLQHAFVAALEQYPPTLGLPPHASARERLDAFVRAFLLRIFDEGRPAWFGKLISREVLDPTSALEDMIQLAILPQYQALESIIREMAPNLNAEQQRRAAFSVVGQCLYYHHCRPVIERITSSPQYTRQNIDRLAEHITAFSFGGVAALAGTAPSGPAGAGP